MAASFQELDFAEMQVRLGEARAERDDARAEVAKLKQENCDLLVGHAELTRRLDAAIKEVQVREEISERKTAESRARLQAEKDAHKRTLSLQDDEVAEFNAGYEACKNGEPIEAEPSDLPFDVWQHGWKVADHERLAAEVADLRAKLADAQEMLSKTLYVSQWRVLSSNDLSYDDLPIGVDSPGRPYCQLPEGHDGPHENRCLACDGTGEIDSEPEYMRCPLCHGSGRGQA